MADIGDLAQIREMDYLQDCLGAVRSFEDTGVVSLTHCEICGEPILEARRVAVPGVRLCIECQEELERGS
jgi:phage/conjugal plasmid C-4 type zinc finger TraR family protein